MTPVIGIDFGTTNSVVALLQPDGSVTTAQFTTSAARTDTFRTVLCFWSRDAAGRSTLHHAAGPRAIEAYLDDPLDTRLIMSMKTYLAQRSFTQTQIYGRPHRLEQMVALFLRALLDGTETAGRIVAGRPVRFAGDLADDTLGEARLRDSFREAGLGEIDVAFEPEAAGYRFTRTLQAPATVLIGDFGGGTSDFSVLRFDPGAARTVTALATAGVGIAGDTFDHRIIDHVVSPYLGKGSTYRVMGTDMPIPAEYYAGLARWHRLSLMRTPRMLREIGDVARTSARPDQLRGLIQLIDDGLGYQLYQTVSAVKAALSRQDQARLLFHHGAIAIDQVVCRADFERWIAPDLAQMSAAVDRALGLAALRDGQVDRVFLTGGTAFVPAVRRLFADRFGADRISGGGEFVSVAEGLALIGRDRALADTVDAQPGTANAAKDRASTS
ncbi:MAG: Hsp70 family protein [Gemmatimonadaceae bacterium]|nr:Hsp70 family protein [Acetobacteraceae bacterium]